MKLLKITGFVFLGLFIIVMLIPQITYLYYISKIEKPVPPEKITISEEDALNLWEKYEKNREINVERLNPYSIFPPLFQYAAYGVREKTPKGFKVTNMIAKKHCQKLRSVFSWHYCRMSTGIWLSRNWNEKQIMQEIMEIDEQYKSKKNNDQFNEKDFDTLLNELVSVAENYPSAGISKNEREISSKIIESKQFNLEKLINLLLHPTPKVRSLAAFTLLNQKTIPEKYFEIIKKSFDMGNGWTPFLFEKIGNKKSIEFLISEFRKNPKLGEQLDHAIVALGEKAAPCLIDYFKDNYDNKEQVLQFTPSLFFGMKETAKNAVPALVDIATDERFDKNTRISALRSISGVGYIEDEDLKKIKNLKSLKSPEINKEIDELLFAVGTKEGINNLLDDIEKEPCCFLLRDLAQKGDKAKFTGERLLKMLDSHNQIDDQIRVCIVLTIGFIGYAHAVEKLEAIAKNNENDWELVYNTIVALEKINSPGSLEFLKDMAENYWYKSVREKAVENIVKIENIVEKNEKGKHTNSAFDYFSFEHAGRKELKDGKKCLEISGAEIEQNHKEIPNDFNKLQYKQEQKIQYNGIDGKSYKEIKKIDVVPELGIKVENGVITGSDRGELGGEIKFFGKNETYLIIESNPVSIRKTKNHGIIAATGLANGFTNKGMLYKIVMKNKKWVAEPWFKLPGQPQFMKVMENGIYVNTRAGGSLLIDNDGHPIQCVSETLNQGSKQ